MSVNDATPHEDFRRLGHEVIDWIADYLANIRDYPVLPEIEPGALAARLPSAGPTQGEPMEVILRDFRDLIVPAATHWNHPRFHGYFAISGSPEGILGEALAAALNMNGMLWKTSPAATELEQVTLNWLRAWIGLPPDFFGIIFDTASVGVLHALIAAREAVNPEARRDGHTLPLIVYTSEQAHSSVEKAAIASGFGQRFVRKIAVDGEFRLRPDCLEEEIRRDAAAGRRPCCVVATAGTTSVASVDPVPEIGAIARRHGVWVHVDGAYGGSAAVAPEHRDVLAGADQADSVVVSPQKWLFTPMDLSVLYTRRPEILRRALSLSPEYLKTSEDERVVNYMDYSIPLGRRFRALKLWFILRRYGREGLAGLIRSHIAWARQLAAWMEEDGRFEVAAPVRLSLVCFRLRGEDDLNRRLMNEVNGSGQAFLSHNVLNGKFVLRCAVGNLQTRAQDVRAVWELIQRAADGL